MLQVCVSIVLDVSATCCKSLFKIFHLLLQACFDLNVAYVSQICRQSMFQMFQLFHSYVAVSVSMLRVASVLCKCCICFTHMLQMYVPNVHLL
jgi:hypothetical protein